MLWKIIQLKERFILVTQEFKIKFENILEMKRGSVGESGCYKRESESEIRICRETEVISENKEDALKKT